MTERRRRAEAHHVGQRVVLRAERALGARQPRHAPVEGVEDHGDEDRDGGVVEALVHRHHDGVEAGEQRRGREQVGQQVDPAAADLACSAAACGSRAQAMIGQRGDHRAARVHLVAERGDRAARPRER